MFELPPNLDLDARLAAGVFIFIAFIDQHRKTVEQEVRLVVSPNLTGHQLKGSLCLFKGIPSVFEFLESVDHFTYSRVPSLHILAKLSDLGEHVGPSGEV